MSPEELDLGVSDDGGSGTSELDVLVLDLLVRDLLSLFALLLFLGVRDDVNVVALDTVIKLNVLLEVSAVEALDADGGEEGGEGLADLSTLLQDGGVLSDETALTGDGDSLSVVRAGVSVKVHALVSVAEPSHVQQQTTDEHSRSSLSGLAVDGNDVLVTLSKPGRSLLGAL